MFVDGVLMSEASPKGPLREGNTVPCLIGAESVGSNMKAGWKGQMDHVAIWNRALTDAEIERLSGGAERIAAARKRSDAGARTFTADKRYLVFPCSRGLGGQNKVFINGDGKPYMSVYDALIASSNPDHWRCIDLKLMQGKTLSVKIEGPNAAGIELVKMSDTMPGKYPVYQESGRPKVHFSPIRGWLNDPCGMIYYEGTWHFYYANSRFNNVMAGPNNAWGHATSTDLLHWEEQPIFLTPIRRECSFWTGGAAVDVENTTGLGRPGKPAIVYSANCGNDTPHDFTQCVFVSTDGGMTAIRNPEMMYKPLPKEDSRRGGGTRDPMILWYAPEKKWVMVVYNQSPGGRNGFHFFDSNDLKGWQETGVLEDMYECPNLFELPVDGNPANRRWVTWGSDTAYHIGTFNGKTFIPEGGKHRTHHGAYSASQVFANAPGGRIVQIGWAHVCDYDTEFTQMASFPLELSLKTTPEGVRLFAEFVPELAGLRGKGEEKRDLAVKPGAPLRLGDVSKPMEIVAEFEPAAASQVMLKGPELAVKWNGPGKELEVNGQRIRLAAQNGVVRLHLLLDIPSVEVASNGGENYLLRARNYQNLRPGSPLEIVVEGGDVLFRRLEVYPLKSIQPGALK
jgi:sucrose-6-phosphate hydrolase SacC (GH32 family)